VRAVVHVSGHLISQDAGHQAGAVRRFRGRRLLKMKRKRSTRIILVSFN
jgi:hypothetical protein